MTKICSVCSLEKPKAKVSYKGPTCNACHSKSYNNGKGKSVRQTYYASKKSDPEFKEKRKTWFKEWYSKSSRTEYKKNWYLKNKERYVKYRNENRDHFLKTQRDWKNKTGLSKFYCAKRRAQQLKATPKWANMEKIKEIYVNCPKGFHVDHVIPLQGEFVSGLHVETNLQYLPAKENCRKGNRLQGDF